VFDCTCNTQNSLLLNQHNGDDAPQDPGRCFMVPTEPNNTCRLQLTSPDSTSAHCQKQCTYGITPCHHHRLSSMSPSCNGKAVRFQPMPNHLQPLRTEHIVIHLLPPYCNNMVLDLTNSNPFHIVLFISTKTVKFIKMESKHNIAHTIKTYS